MTEPGEQPVNKGGRPSRAEERARLLADLEDADVLVGVEALRLVRNKETPPSVRLQCLQLLEGLSQRLKAGESIGGAASGDAALSVDDFLRDLRVRVVLLQEHYGRGIVELLGDVTVDLAGPRDARIT
ncbi:MAG TPA: hypothetical protein VJX91_00140 [Candidatus Eisenbacteria bacterium]|nr:hypothetical protein [Candidatus Eisenbacteria bacterium]